MVLIIFFIFRVLFETILNYKEIMQLLQVFEIKVYHLTYRENKNFRQQFLDQTLVYIYNPTFPFEISQNIFFLKN